MSQSVKKLIAQVDSLAERHSKPNFGEQCGLFVACIMSLGITSMHSKADPARLRSVHMPDKWFAAVAATPEITEKGIRFLSETLERKGYVTVADAVNWASMERKQFETPKARAAEMEPFVEKVIQSRGAAALQERARALAVKT
jgi:hypothetical protein